LTVQFFIFNLYASQWDVQTKFTGLLPISHIFGEVIRYKDF